MPNIAEDEERRQVDHRYEQQEQHDVRRNHGGVAEIEAHDSRAPARSTAAARPPAISPGAPRERARQCPRWRAPPASARSSATACAGGKGWRGRKAARRRRSSPDSLPEFRQALDRDRHRRLELLGEKRDAQLLQQPAELLERLRRRALASARSRLPPVRHFERRQVRGQARVARRIDAQLVETQRSRLQIARSDAAGAPTACAPASRARAGGRFAASRLRFRGERSSSRPASSPALRARRGCRRRCAPSPAR